MANSVILIKGDLTAIISYREVIYETEAGTYKGFVASLDPRSNNPVGNLLSHVLHVIDS